MLRLKENLYFIIEHSLPWFVLAILLMYSYAKFFEHPYLGFKLDANGQVIQVYVPGNVEPSLETGDRIIQIYSLLWDDYKNNLRHKLLDGAQVGQVILLEVEHAGQLATVRWTLPGPNTKEVFDLLVNEGWFAFAFWIIGSATLYISRPKDERWRLLVGFNYLTAIWVVAGSGVSFYHIWDSALVLRMVIWLSVPVYLFLGWVFPKPLGKRPRKLVWGGYLVAIVFAIAEWFQILPTNLYFAGFIIAVGGSILLFIVHAVFQVEVRRDLWLVVIAGLLSLFPAILLGLISIFSHLPITASASLISIPFLPLAYFYAAYRHQLGDFEIRVNRIVLAYVFITLVLTILLPLIILVTIWLPTPEIAILIGATVTFLAATLSIFGFPHFQSLMERSLLGIHITFEKLQANYASRIVTSTSIVELGTLLQEEVLPSLLVRQFVFLEFVNNLPKIVLAIQTTSNQIPDQSELARLLKISGKYQPLNPSEIDETRSWIRLIMPLRIGDRLVGLWLFGRRDPDDVYSQIEIPSLQTLADQTAIALSYIVQTERLKTMYRTNIERYEDERLHLALDLHDGVLNQIAAILMKLDTSAISSGSEITYGVLIQRLREIISSLRPPMLNYGLKAALDDLADQLMIQTEDSLNVSIEIVSNDIRYPPNFEQHLYRIVQEACQNSLKHGHATEIHISGRLDPQKLHLNIDDNGIGFDATKLDLDSLITNKHFGLTGIIQRAELIGAEAHIQSEPGAGTQISIIWHSQDTEDI